jgi:hypothetical protein
VFELSNDHYTYSSAKVKFCHGQEVLHELALPHTVPEKCFSFGCHFVLLVIFMLVNAVIGQTLVSNTGEPSICCNLNSWLVSFRS